MVMQRAFQVLYIVWIVTEILVLIVTKTRKGGGEISDRGSLRVLWAVNFVSLTVGIWMGSADRFGAMPRFAWLPYAVVGLLAVGLAVRWTAIWQLGRAFSVNVAIRTDQRLNRSGLFGVVRHPSYTGLVLIFMGVGLSTWNWVGLAVIVLGPVAALLYRINVEEAALAGAFGEEYVAYCGETKRLFPGVY